MEKARLRQVRTWVVGLVGVLLSFLEPGGELLLLLLFALVSLISCTLGADGTDAGVARHLHCAEGVIVVSGQVFLAVNVGEDESWNVLCLAVTWVRDR